MKIGSQSPQWKAAYLYTGIASDLSEADGHLQSAMGVMSRIHRDVEEKAGSQWAHELATMRMELSKMSHRMDALTDVLIK